MYYLSTGKIEIKFNKLWFSLEQLEYLPYCHNLESSQLQKLKNWEKSIIIDTPVINPLL